MAVNEGLIKRVFKEVLDVDVETPFRRMPWQRGHGPLRLRQAGHPLRL